MLKKEYGITFGTLHSWRDLHLAMEERQEISEAKPDLLQYKVTGSNRLLDVSESLTGRVTFQPRTMKFDFFLIEGVKNWAYRYSEIQRVLHGKWMRIVCDDDPYFFYEGRVHVDEIRSSRYLGRIAVTADVHPYKFEINHSLEPWLWSPFDFRVGVIRNYGRLTATGALDPENSIAVNGNESATLTIIGTPMPVIPTFYAKSTDGDGITVKYNGTSYGLYLTDATHTVAGHNVIEGVTAQPVVITSGGMEYDNTTGAIQIPDIEIAEGDHVFSFSGHGAVAVYYRGGRL